MDNDTITEMSVPRNFYKNKRGVLIYSTAVIVLCLTQHNADELTTKFGELSLSARPTVVVFGLLLAAIYHAVGFSIDAFVARIVSSKATDGIGVDGLRIRVGVLTDSLDQLGNQIILKSNEYLALEDRLIECGKQLTSNIEDIDKGFPGSVAGGVNQHLMMGDHLVPERTAEIPQHTINVPNIERFSKVVDSAILNALSVVDISVHNFNLAFNQERASIITAQKVLVSSIEGIKYELSNFSDRMNRLSRRILRSVRFSFTWWDVFVPFFLLGFAIICAAPSLMRFVQRDAMGTARDYAQSFKNAKEVTGSRRISPVDNTVNRNLTAPTRSSQDASYPSKNNLPLARR